MLTWLGTFPGESWQQRWCSSPAPLLGQQWVDAAMDGLNYRSDNVGKEMRTGLLALLCADVLRPDLEWLVKSRSPYWAPAMAAHRDPSGFTALEASLDPVQRTSRLPVATLSQIAKLLIAKGGGIRDITVGDCLELRAAEVRVLAHGAGRTLFYSLLKGMDIFPDDAPVTLNRLTSRVGQQSPTQLIDRYGLRYTPVRDLLIDYLYERQPAVDYTTLEDLARTLGLLFWKDIESHTPGTDSLRLTRATASAWKERLRTKTTRRRLPDGTVAEITSQRKSYTAVLTGVRGFYLDIAEWALEDPARWGPWAVPCPIRAAEVSGWQRKRPAVRPAWTRGPGNAFPSCRCWSRQPNATSTKLSSAWRPFVRRGQATPSPCWARPSPGAVSLGGPPATAPNGP
ncbi:hypothetical protein AB0N81_41760 [Streptomyces sp. NPDC093510]|uniref:hypothetical protein n=1 Tax=Streptomyces sp. NPDC093510 TaxID=3155199 RepID=UPI00342BE331